MSEAIIWFINLVICLLPSLYTFWFFVDRRYYTGSIEVNVCLCVMSVAFIYNATTFMAQDPENLQWDYTLGRALFFAAFLFLIQVIKHCHPDKALHQCNIKEEKP